MIKILRSLTVPVQMTLLESGECVPVLMNLVRYDNAVVFLAAIKSKLEEQEIIHMFPLWAASVLAQEPERNGYCGAVWIRDELVLAIVAFDQGLAFASLLFDESMTDAIGTLLQDLRLSSTRIKGLHATLPLLIKLRETWVGQDPTTHFSNPDPVWVYVLSRDQDKLIATDLEGRLRLASVDQQKDMNAVHELTKGFIEDCEKDLTAEDVDKLCHEDLQAKRIYLWQPTSSEGQVVATARTRRPLGNSISISYVYTIPAFRGRGYAQAMVSSLTKNLLEDYAYITLLVDAEQNRKDNLYTRIGYRYVGTLAKCDCC